MFTHLVDHPLAAVRLTSLRDISTDRAGFRQATSELSRFVVYEALRSLPTVQVEIETPLESTHGTEIATSPMIVPIVRAGLGMLDAALELIPNAPVGFLGLKRDEDTLQPEVYMNTVPPDLDGRTCLILDPMLATGGSLIHACNVLRETNAGDIIVACLLAAPEGIDALSAVHDDAVVFTASIDESLNDIGFIRPGLGDAGDRQFGLD